MWMILMCACGSPHWPPQKVYAASKDRFLRLWDYSTSECLQTFSVRETVRSMVR